MQRSEINSARANHVRLLSRSLSRGSTHQLPTLLLRYRGTHMYPFPQEGVVPALLETSPSGSISLPHAGESTTLSSCVQSMHSPFSPSLGSLFPSPAFPVVRFLGKFAGHLGSPSPCLLYEDRGRPEPVCWRRGKGTPPRKPSLTGPLYGTVLMVIPQMGAFHFLLFCG
jgi:hypothetical protein